jgi:hypothetical protein
VYCADAASVLFIKALKFIDENLLNTPIMDCSENPSQKIGTESQAR